MAVHTIGGGLRTSRGSLGNTLSRRGRLRNPELMYRDNTVDAFNVQLWANESLAILVENMVMGNLVHRDFENLISSYGNVVNTRKPGEFHAKRKTNADPVTVQNAVVTNIPVKLDQQVHVTYMIKDGEESIAFQSIIDEFLRPAMIAHAQFIDHVLSSQVYQFLPNNSGQLTKMTNANGKDYILADRKVMNDNKVWQAGRYMVVDSNTESLLLSQESFTDAQRVGDLGFALREAVIGRKLGFDFFMAQNQPHVTAQSNVVLGAINLGAGYAAGSSSFVVDGLSAAITAGTWMTINGDDTPLQVTGTTGGATPTAITTAQATKRAVADNAVITLFPVGVVTNGPYTYDATTGLGYAKYITFSGISVAPQVGQMVSFGTTTNLYAVIEVSGTNTILLDRPLETTVATSDKVNFGPSGSFNLGFHPNAIALVSRPMALPRKGTGALAAVVNWNNMSIRVVITYDGTNQGHLVTIDILLGVKTLDQLLGSVMFA